MPGDGTEPAQLRFITCGSVDDGKSTLIGRLLYDSKALFTDQLAALQRDSRDPAALDFASLVDGLAAERAEGITIDVAYRFFATPRRRFIVADTPGHARYTRNMVTGASTADAAIVLVDARHGIREQTRRHSLLVHLLGIRHIALAVNKMDLVGHDRAVVDRIVADHRGFAQAAGIGTVTAIPMIATTGDNVTAHSPALPWYEGPHLLDWLESVPATGAADGRFRMPVQSVNHHQGKALHTGRIAAGTICVGDPLVLLPSGKATKVVRIMTMDGDLAEASAGHSVALELTGAEGIRGDLLAAAADPPTLSDRLTATLIWLAGTPMNHAAHYLLKIGTRTVTARITAIDALIDIAAMADHPGRPLILNDIARTTLTLGAPVAAIPYAQSRTLGGFILIDPVSNATVAAGLVG